MSAICRNVFVYLITFHLFVVVFSIHLPDLVPWLCGYEYCSQKWTTPNYSEHPKKVSLKDFLEDNVHGQHIAVETISKVVEGHLKNPKPNKALVLSLHGWTGSGKNFISRLVAEHLYQKGLESEFVHQIIGTHHFPHKSELEKYKEDLKSWVHGNVSKCERSFFIFDEMDKIPQGLVGVLKPFLEHRNKVDGTDFRKSIFFFLSNTGGKSILDEALKLQRSGKRREELTIKHMDSLLSKETLKSDGGFWHSELIQEHLIGYFVPLLPMERSHVKLCAKSDMEMKGYNISEKNLELVADQLEYFPEEERIYSISGCKKVSVKVDLIMG